MASRAQASSTWCIHLAYASLLLPLALSLSPCPQGKSPVLNDKVERSKVVVQGQVRRQLEVRDSSYTAEVQVQCVFKGGPVSSVINVTVGGRAEGRCVQTVLSMGRTYLIYLREGGQGASTYTPTFTQDPAERKYLDELKFACGLRVQLPTGVSESATCVPGQFVPDYVLEDCEDRAPSGSPAVTGIRSCLLFLTSLFVTLFL